MAKPKRLVILASGGESTTSTMLLNNQINFLSRDGRVYAEVNDSPSGDQFTYDDATGIIAYDPLYPTFEVNEQVIIDYENEIETDIIQSVAVTGLSNTTATVSWTTAVNTNAEVDYWITSGSVFVKTDDTVGLSHSIALSGLTAGTLYNFTVISVDIERNTYSETGYTFTTTGSGSSDVTPPVVSAIVATPQALACAITWTTDEVATSRVEYGLTTGYGSSTTIDTTLVTAHTATIVGLTASTAYHYRIKSKDASGNLTTTSDHTFTTSAAGSGHPLFGCIINDNTLSVHDKVAFAKDNTNGMGMSYFRGAHVGVADYNTGDGNLAYKQCHDQGIYYVVNLNWNTASGGSNLFASNKVTYQAQIGKIMNDWASDIAVVKCIVIENEPYNVGFYGDTMQNYVQQLGWAIEKIHTYTGCKVADGCVHSAAVLQLKNALSGDPNGILPANIGGITRSTYTILRGIRDLRIAGYALDYCNLHSTVTGTLPATNDMKNAAQFVRDMTGIQDIINNEMPYKAGFSDSRGTTMVNECDAAGLKIAIMYGGGCPNDNVKPFNSPCSSIAGRTTLASNIKTAIAAL